MRIYNMSPAELKALNQYINDALAKGWIQESQSPADAPILGSFRTAISAANRCQRNFERTFVEHTHIFFLLIL